MPAGAALDENAIVEAVCGYLTERGWQIAQRLTTKQSGVDIIAVRNGGRLLVEAKGGTSSLAGSARFGKAYTNTQAFDRVAKGLLTGFELLDRYPGDQVALAFPADPYFLRYVGRVQVALARTGLKIFWVARDGIVAEGVAPPSA